LREFLIGGPADLAAQPAAVRGPIDVLGHELALAGALRLRPVVKVRDRDAERRGDLVDIAPGVTFQNPPVVIRAPARR
jgi:hypothetical protein